MLLNYFYEYIVVVYDAATVFYIFIIMSLMYLLLLATCFSIYYL